jgi:hypothetical protein
MDRIQRLTGMLGRVHGRTLTVFDVALADSLEAHIDAVRRWSRAVWDAWSQYRAPIARLVTAYLEENLCDPRRRWAALH